MGEEDVKVGLGEEGEGEREEGEELGIVGRRDQISLMKMAGLCRLDIQILGDCRDRGEGMEQMEEEVEEGKMVRLDYIK